MASRRNSCQTFALSAPATTCRGAVKRRPVRQPGTGENLKCPDSRADPELQTDRPFETGGRVRSV